MSNNSNQVAAIYVRVSTGDKQDYQRQINDLKKIAASKNYETDKVDVFAEKLSGYKKASERPELDRMLTEVRKSPENYGCVFVTEISRLGRNPTETRKIIDELSEIGVAVYIQSLDLITLKKDGTRDGITNIILQVLMEFADDEAKKFKFRSSSGLLESARKGKASGGRFLPYGYTKNEEKFLVPDEEEKQVIQQIFTLYKHGKGAKAITNYLNDKGIPTRANKAFGDQELNFTVTKPASSIRWSDKTVLDIIKNPIYIGERQFKGETVPSPALISKELFDQCRVIRETKSHRNYLTTYTYLLKDLMSCGICGRNYFARYKPVPRGDKVYICSSRLKRAGNCGNVGLNIDMIDSIIFHELATTESIEKYIGERDELIAEFKERINQLKSEIQIKSNKVANLLSNSDKLLDLYIEDNIAKNKYLKKSNGITEEVEKLEKSINRLQESLTETNIALEQQQSPTNSINSLQKANGNRQRLKTLYQKIIAKIILNVIEEKYMLATVFIKVDGVTLRRTLKLLVDLSGSKKRVPQYKYLSNSFLENDPLYDDQNILLVETSDILEEFLARVGKPGASLKPEQLWKTVPVEHQLRIQSKPSK